VVCGSKVLYSPLYLCSSCSTNIDFYVDNVLVTSEGYENLTTVVKDVTEMERLINEV
jgi:hypothetical protein